MPIAPGVRCKACRKIHAGTGLCPACRSLAEKARGSSTQRGYDAEYVAQLQADKYRNATHCTSCGKAFTKYNPKTGGHTTAIRNGGRGSKVEAQCRTCNYGWRRTGL